MAGQDNHRMRHKRLPRQLLPSQLKIRVDRDIKKYDWQPKALDSQTWRTIIQPEAQNRVIIVNNGLQVIVIMNNGVPALYDEY